MCKISSCIIWKEVCVCFDSKKKELIKRHIPKYGQIEKANSTENLTHIYITPFFWLPWIYNVPSSSLFFQQNTCVFLPFLPLFLTFPDNTPTQSLLHNNNNIQSLYASQS
mmetsp:Transcript_12575/g.18789  ORF Transcript_12575/g.18789 Transcript_12575/m.18789 type:complete len:110 (-) Transcript_12575:804-1133(-)